MSPFEKLVIVYGGELAQDVAERIKAKQSGNIQVVTRNASERPKTLIDFDSKVLVCFVMQTIENAAPTEDGGATARFFKRKTHPDTLLENKFHFCVLGVGDSNLLLDRQTTTAKDCNQVAQELDQRLASLGGSRFYDIGMADERHGLQEVEPWIAGLWDKLQQE
jgi:sulfite reductase alpha subunit-like flavoprotein